MRIDLHAHTQKCKKGDSDKRVISSKAFVKKMLDNGVGVCSITNHNKFDLSEYEEVRNISENLIVFPGIELDINYNGKKRQVIVVCKPEIGAKFYSIFDNDPHRKLEDYELAYNTFLEKIKLFKTNEIIIIAHFMNKANGFTAAERKALYLDLASYTLILETSNLRTMGFVNGHKESLSLIGSDVTDWNNYDPDELPELKFMIDSFGKFYELASDPKNFVKNFLDGATKHKITLDHTGSSVDIFDDINVIFGEKGSGKTILIKNHISPGLEATGKKVKLHLGSKYKDDYEQIIRERSSTVEIAQDHLAEINNEFENVIAYKEQPHKNFIVDYFAYKKDTNKNKQAESIHKRNSPFSNSNDENIESIIENSKRDNKKISEVQAINDEIKRGSEDRRKSLHTELDSLRKDIQKNTARSLRRHIIMNGTEKLLRAIQETVKKETGAISKPSSIGFAKLVSNRRVRLRSNSQLIKSLDATKDSMSYVIGKLPKKGKVYLDVEVKVMPYDFKYEKGSEFDKSKVKQNRTLIKKIRNFSALDFNTNNLYFSDDDITSLPSGEEFADEVVKKEVKIRIDDEKNYIPSDGEQAILSISAILESSDYDCYLFDEIEKGLGHKYISEYLLPKLKSLRDRGKTIVLSTHDANIAVSTLPSQTIFCSWPDGGIYFTGNMYAGELIDIKNGNKLDWLEKAILHLEGGDKMFNTRRNIYGI